MALLNKTGLIILGIVLSAVGIYAYTQFQDRFFATMEEGIKKAEEREIARWQEAMEESRIELQPKDRTEDPPTIYINQ